MKNRLWMISILCLFLFASVPMSAFASGASSASADLTPYTLDPTLKTGVKSILNERVVEGTRIGAVVRVYNQGSKVALIPQYEVRVVTSSGIIYTLQPSKANAGAVQPMETVELSYMIVVNRQDQFSLEKLIWLTVDEYVYPKKEKIHLTVPISKMEWKGGGTVLTDPNKSVKWGDSFTLPESSAALVYRTAQYISRDTPNGTDKIVVLHVRNTGQKKEWLPDFSINGKSNMNVYPGVKLEQERVSLEPGGQRFLHFSIPMRVMEPLNRLTIVSPGTFVSEGQTAVHFSVGKLQIQLPLESVLELGITVPYKIKNPIRIDPIYTVTGSTVEAALVELYRYQSDGDGYQTATVKLQLTNRNNRPVTLPNYEMEWMTEKGYSYTGTRQNTVWTTLMPNLSYVFSYSFKIPVSDDKRNVTVNLLKNQGDIPYAIPVASLRTTLQEEQEANGNHFSFYPYEIEVKTWSLHNFFSGPISSTSSFRLTMNLAVTLQDNAVVDSSSSKVKIELVDAAGLLLGSTSIPLSGEGRLVNGEQTIFFENIQTDLMKRPIRVHIYEAFETPEGEVKRLLKTLQ